MRRSVWRAAESESARTGDDWAVSQGLKKAQTEKATGRAMRHGRPPTAGLGLGWGWMREAGGSEGCCCLT